MKVNRTCNGRNSCLSRPRVFWRVTAVGDGACSQKDMDYRGGPNGDPRLGTSRITTRPGFCLNAVI